MYFKKITLLAATAVAGLTAVPASAAPILFELTGSRNATFTIDTATPPTTQTTGIFGTQISYAVVPGTFNGAPGNATVGFATGDIFADLNITGTTLGFTQFVSSGDLFSLVGNMPVFNLGTFNLTSIVSGNSTLRISAAAGAVPEPATWGLMLLGFGVMGGALRRRQTTARIRFA